MHITPPNIITSPSSSSRSGCRIDRGFEQPRRSQNFQRVAASRAARRLASRSSGVFLAKRFESRRSVSKCALESHHSWEAKRRIVFKNVSLFWFGIKVFVMMKVDDEICERVVGVRRRRRHVSLAARGEDSISLIRSTKATGAFFGSNEHQSTT